MKVHIKINVLINYTKSQWQNYIVTLLYNKYFSTVAVLLTDILAYYLYDILCTSPLVKLRFQVTWKEDCMFQTSLMPISLCLSSTQRWCCPSEKLWKKQLTLDSQESLPLSHVQLQATTLPFRYAHFLIFRAAQAKPELQVRPLFFVLGYIFVCTI